MSQNRFWVTLVALSLLIAVIAIGSMVFFLAGVSFTPAKQPAATFTMSPPHFQAATPPPEITPAVTSPE